MAKIKTLWHDLDDAIDASNLPASDRAVFKRRLKRADYDTAELPERFTETQSEVGKAVGITERQVRRSERHLERHRWMKITKNPGRGKKSGYVLRFGDHCDCDGRVHEPKADTASQKSGHEVRRKADTGSQKSGHEVRRKADTESGHAAGQGPVSTERLREEKREGAVAVRCRVCETAMDPVLAVGGYTTHPNCDPDEVRPMVRPEEKQ